MVYCQMYWLQSAGKALLLKTQLIYVIEDGEIEIVSTQKCHPFWLVFMLLEGTLYTAGGEK